MSDLVWRKSSYSDSGGGECVEVATEWRKSSYSGPGGGECVEVAEAWRKSSRSDSGGGDCVEIAAAPVAVHVRDSKRVDGPVLCVPPRAWEGFLTLARTDRVS